MIVRRIQKEELKRVQQIASLAFEFSFDCPKTALAYAEETMASPGSREDTDPSYNIAAFEDDGRTMMSSMWVIPFTVRFDGREAGMFGIGGVSTLPVYRRGGGIRACFEKALPEMYEAGAVFSYLYPFSTVFYRQFGYELGCECQRLLLRLERIPKWDMGGRCVLLEADAPCREDVKRVYGAWAARYNMMTLDEQDVDYAWLNKLDPFKTREYSYLYYGASGEPKGFMTFQPKNDTETRELWCSRFCYTDVEGLKGLWTLLRSLASDHHTASLLLPSDTPWQRLIPEHSLRTVERQTITRGMTRVVNVQKALEMARPRGTGTLVLAVADVQIARNDGAFEARFEDGRMFSVRRTDAEPDLRMGVGDFSRLILGLCDVDELPYLEDVQVFCEPAKAARLFYRKPCYITKPF